MRGTTRCTACVPHITFRDDLFEIRHDLEFILAGLRSRDSLSEIEAPCVKEAHAEGAMG